MRVESKEIWIERVEAAASASSSSTSIVVLLLRKPKKCEREKYYLVLVGVVRMIPCYLAA
jgi:hypothetical protein